MKHQYTIALLALALCPLMLTAQQLPKWIAQPPVKNGVRRAVGQGSTADGARLSAVAQLVDGLNINSEEGSLREVLTAAGEQTDQRQALTRVAIGSTCFRNVECYENDTATWVMCEIKATDLKTFIDSVQAAAIDIGARSLAQAQRNIAVADVPGTIAAASRGLLAVAPVMHRRLETDLLPGTDLGLALRNALLAAFDSLDWDGRHGAPTTEAADNRPLPMVSGAPLPIGVTVSITRHGKPAVAMPLSVHLSPAGSVSANPVTDTDGKATANITAAPKAQQAALTFAFDAKPLAAGIPGFMQKAFARKADSIAARTWHVALRAFDPTPCCILQYDTRDSAALAGRMETMVSAKGYRLTTDMNEADLMLKASSNGEISSPYKAGDHTLVNYTGSLTLQLLPLRGGDAPLAEAALTDFKLLQPAMKLPDRMHHRAVTEMLKRLSDTMEERLEQVDYDKAAIVFDTAR